MHFSRVTVLLLPSLVAAQTYTDCNPTNETCPSDTGLSSSTYSVDFTQGSSSDWNMTYGTAGYDATNGASFTVNESGDAPTMQSNFYFFFGVLTVIAKAANGTGIVSCAILESDDLDEIDWEWLGGDVDQVQTNYFGKGNTTSYDRGTYVTVSDTQKTWHNYTIEWTSASTTWYVDSVAVRTLLYADAVDGKNYPQTPMHVKLGLWSASDSGASGTIEWAGGDTDFDKSPFTMYVQRVDITNYNPGSTYTYGDLTGSYSSIEIDASGATSTNKTSSGSISDDTPTGNSTSTSTAAASSKTSSSTATTASGTATGSSTASTSSTATSAAGIASVPNSVIRNTLTAAFFASLAVAF